MTKQLPTPHFKIDDIVFFVNKHNTPTVDKVKSLYYDGLTKSWFYYTNTNNTVKEEDLKYWIVEDFCY